MPMSRFKSWKRSIGLAPGPSRNWFCPPWDPAALEFVTLAARDHTQRFGARQKAQLERIALRESELARVRPWDQARKMSADWGRADLKRHRGLGNGWRSQNYRYLRLAAYRPKRSTLLASSRRSASSLKRTMKKALQESPILSADRLMAVKGARSWRLSACWWLFASLHLRSSTRLGVRSVSALCALFLQYPEHRCPADSN